MTVLSRLIAKALRAATPRMEDLARALKISGSALRAYRLGTRKPAPTFRSNLARVLRAQSERLQQIAKRLEEDA